MKKQFISPLLLLALSLLCVSQPLRAAKPIELEWQQLIPKGHTSAPANVSAHDESSQANWVQPDLNAPVVEKYNNKVVSLPGFVVPLEGTNEVITEFLLVPFFGACIHVPPPPPNQIVYVKFPDGVPIESLYDAIVVTGTLTTQSWEGELAKVAYHISGIGVAPYD